MVGKQRPLTAAEITHLYSNIQTNHMGRAVITGIGQVADLKDVRDYHLAVNYFTKFLLLYCIYAKLAVH